jgi:hypothetical protein
VTNHEASAPTTEDPATNTLVAKTAYQPSSVFVAAPGQDVQHDQVDVGRETNIIQMISRKERAEPLRQMSPPR